MALNDTFYGLEMSQNFPQPTRPGDAYEYGNIFESKLSENRFTTFHEKGEDEDEETSVSDDEEVKTLKGFLEEVDESVKILIAKVGKKIKLERIIKETLEDYRGDTYSDIVEKIRGKLNHCMYEYNDAVNMERGVDLDSRSIGEESDLKMERFKVKALNLAGGTKQGQK